MLRSGSRPRRADDNKASRGPKRCVSGGGGSCTRRKRPMYIDARCGRAAPPMRVPVHGSAQRGKRPRRSKDRNQPLPFRWRRWWTRRCRPGRGCSAWRTAGAGTEQNTQGIRACPNPWRGAKVDYICRPGPISCNTRRTERLRAAAWAVVLPNEDTGTTPHMAARPLAKTRCRFFC